jgi:hypothetical protein
MLTTVLLHLLFFGQPVEGVSVSTDMSAYAQGDPVLVTIQNTGPDAITRGGIVCDDVWPLAVEQLQDDGSWQGVVVPRRASCIGITGVLFQPGRTLTQTLSLSLDPGTYRVAYAFDVVGSGPAPNAGQIAYSDPFDVNAPAGAGLWTASGSRSVAADF